jgi:hypothetical protein
MKRVVKRQTARAVKIGKAAPPPPAAKGRPVGVQKLTKATKLAEVKQAIPAHGPAMPNAPRVAKAGVDRLWVAPAAAGREVRAKPQAALGVGLKKGPAKTAVPLENVVNRVKRPR